MADTITKVHVGNTDYDIEDAAAQATLTAVVPADASNTNKLTTNTTVDNKIKTAIGDAIAAAY